MKKFYSIICIMMAVAPVISAVVPTQRFSKRNADAPLFAPSAEVEGRPVTVLEEDFSKFTAGSEDEPSSRALATDWYGHFSSSKVSTPDWGGNGVHEAGGTAFIENGKSLWSPTIDMSDAINSDIVLTFRARLANSAENEGVPSLTMGYGEPTRLPELEKQWKEYRVEISGAYSGADFTFNATADWLIDDIKFVKYVSYINAPVGLSFNNYTITGFRAVWQPVDGADHYLVSVSSVDDTQTQLTPVIDDIVAQENYCDIAGLPEIDNLFCFSVTSVDAEGHRSPKSFPLLVEALLTPATYEATDVTANGFNAAWEAVPGAEFYDFYVYRHTVADKDTDFAFVDTDFSFITSETASDEQTVSFDMLPGWIINVPLFEEGAIGMDGARAPIETTLFASMESPAYNLSAGGGDVEVTVSVRSTRGAKVTFSLYTMANGSYPIYPESYVALEGLPFDQYVTRTFTLTGGGENSVIYIETADWGQAWISDLKISQHIKAGESVATPVVNYVTDTNSAQVQGLDLTDGYKYYYTVRAVGISRDEEYYISSDFTAPHFVAYDPAGIEDVTLGDLCNVTVDGNAIVVTNPSGDTVSVYDTRGRLLRSFNECPQTLTIPMPAGLYIVRVGDRAFKLTL